MKKTRFSIYQITCKANSKCYVGYTDGPIEKRWRQHLLYSRHPKNQFHKDIKKYGPGLFEMKEIDFHYEEMQEMVLKKEKYWIFMLDTIHPRGYNNQKISVGNNLAYIYNRLKRSKRLTSELKERIDKIVYGI